MSVEFALATQGIEKPFVLSSIVTVPLNVTGGSGLSSYVTNGLSILLQGWVVRWLFRLIKFFIIFISLSLLIGDGCKQKWPYLGSHVPLARIRMI